jgi:hypothetical protein
MSVPFAFVLVTGSVAEVPLATVEHFGVTHFVFGTTFGVGSLVESDEWRQFAIRSGGVRIGSLLGLRARDGLGFVCRVHQLLATCQSASSKAWILFLVHCAQDSGCLILA